MAAGKNWEVQKKEFADCGSLADLKMRWALGSLLLALVHHSSSSARRNSRRMLISEAPTASEYVNVQEGRQGRQIQPLACVSKSGGEKGVCMFAWNCVEAGGQHLGTCIDRFVSLSQKNDNYSQFFISPGFISGAVASWGAISRRQEEVKEAKMRRRGS